MWGSGGVLGGEGEGKGGLSGKVSIYVRIGRRKLAYSRL